MQSLVRRRLVTVGLGGLAGLALVRPAAARASLEEAIAAFTGGAAPLAERIALEIPPLVENGNAVGVTVRVESPMTEADHIRRIALFTERNPNPEVAVFHLGPRSGEARVATRIRLSTTQVVAALAEAGDGRCYMASASVHVALAACIEDL